MRDLLCKIQTLNEGLAQDKIELNKIILLVGIADVGRRRRSLCLQVEQEKNAVHNEKSDVEQDKSTLRQVTIFACEKLHL